MQFHVAQNGEKTGPFEREEVLRRLVAGELKGSDLGWHEGLADWEPLSKLIPPPIPNPAAQPVFGPATASGTAPIVAAGSSGMALASMICGILGLLLWLPCIPAIILGHLSLSAIKKSAGALGGRGMAITGLVTGYLMIAAIPLIAILASLAIPAFNQVQIQGNQMKAVNNAKQIVLGMKQYAADHEGKYPATLEPLFEEQILTDRRLLEFPSQLNVPDQGWEYLGAGHTDTDPGNLIILTSRKADRTKKKIVARNDGSVSVEREDAVP
jgi:type II secretory pathway pseudopilin PulG